MDKKMIPGEYDVEAITQEQEGSLHPTGLNPPERIEETSVDEVTALEHRREGGGAKTAEKPRKPRAASKA